MAKKLLYWQVVIFLLALCLCETVQSQKTISALRTDLENATSARAKADICFEIAGGYSSLLKIDSALYFTSKIKEYSEQSNYETGIGKYHLAFADAVNYRNRNDEAEENLFKAIEIFTRQKEVVLFGRAYLVLGNTRYMTNRISLARENYWTAISIFGPLREARGLYASYLWMGRGYFKTAEIDSAAFYFIKMLSIAEQLNEPDKIFIAGCLVGRSFLSLGELEKAVIYFGHALIYRKPQTDKIGLRGFLRDYAICLILTHEFHKADSVIKDVESVNALLKDGYGLAVINRLQGTLEYERRNYREAVTYIKQAFTKMAELKILNSETKDIVLLLGKAEYEMHNYDSAVIHLRSAILMARESRALTDEEAANLLISKSFQQMGNADSALYYFMNYSVLKDSLLSIQKQRNIIEVTTRYETEKKEQEIKLLQGENKLTAYQLKLKNGEIEKQGLLDAKKSQQLMLLSQQSEISRLEAAQKNLALENQGKEIVKKQGELELLSKESQLQTAVAAKENQQKKFAYAAALAILFFGGIIYYRYQQSNKLGKQLNASLVSLREAQGQLVKAEKEKEAENIRVRISRDIHDEVGATLSGVALFSEIAKQKMEDHQSEDALVYLNHISTNSKEMVEKMSDIVWTINPDNDGFDRIIAKLQSFAFNLCAGKGISLHIDIDDKIKKHLPDMLVKRNLYLFSKEAINNAVKYSGGKNIHLSMEQEGDYLTAEIKDDGIGFDRESSFMGNGLKNMKARADNLDAAFSIESVKGMGTSVRLKFHFHPAG